MIDPIAQIVNNARVGALAGIAAAQAHRLPLRDLVLEAEDNPEAWDILRRSLERRLPCASADTLAALLAALTGRSA